MDSNDIKRNLETEYDIPFTVSKHYEKGEPVFIMGPQDEEKELFSIKISFRNRVRLYMDFVPHKYSAGFIETMSIQPDENRKRFVKYAELITKMGAKYIVSVNGMPLNMDDTLAWPVSWKDFQLRITKMPVETENDASYAEVANIWGSLMMGMVLSLADIVPVDATDVVQGYAEGDSKRTEINRYERNPLNRKLCLAAHGYDCAVCGMNFERRYGSIGNNFIHVHHVSPVSQLGKGHIIDPLTDLIPVCPNCHAMLHKSDPPMEPEKLKSLLKSADENMIYRLNQLAKRVAEEGIDNNWI